MYQIHYRAKGAHGATVFKSINVDSLRRALACQRQLAGIQNHLTLRPYIILPSGQRITMNQQGEIKRLDMYVRRPLKRLEILFIRIKQKQALHV